MKIVEGNVEEMAEESAQDRRDHAALQVELANLLKQEDGMRIPIAVRRLIDAKVDPLVIAKQLLVGDRYGGLVYTLACSKSVALSNDESITKIAIDFALDGVRAPMAGQMLIAGAVWLATQFGLNRELLRSLVRAAAIRPRTPTFAGCGVVDLVDNWGVATRAWLDEAIGFADLPLIAPLEYRPGE